MKLAVCLVAALGVSMQADVRTSRRDAMLLKQKVATINAHAEKATRQPRKTLVTESEVNSYLVYEAREQLPTGVVHFELESAAISRLPIPKFLLQEIVGYYSRTATNPAGIKLDDPFALPARIREIQVERGQAIIVQ